MAYVQSLSKEQYEQRSKQQRILVITAIFALLVGSATFFFSDKSKTTNSLIAFVVTFAVIQLYILGMNKLKGMARIKKMEDMFPDFIELVASNLRAGMTVDRSLLLSSRKEFAPLDKEILNLGKDLMTGKEISGALRDMGVRIGSEKIRKTIDLIVSGIVSGGNLSVLLEEVSSHMRERRAIEKKATSNVLMYLIFIFIAVSVGAPLLFGLSVVLVSVLTKILVNVPAADAMATTKLPFTMSKISISINFVKYYAVLFILVLDAFASMILGLVNKGDYKEGLKYIPPLAIISLLVFFLVQTFLGGILSGAFG